MSGDQVTSGALDLEAEAIDLVLALDAGGTCSGPRAFELYQRTVGARLRPALIRQRESVVRAIDQTALTLAADAFELEARAIWSELIAQLRAMASEETRGAA